MKNFKYTAAVLSALFLFAACQEDKTLDTTDKGPEMQIVSVGTSGVYGGKVPFTVTLNDQQPLSTLKAQLFFDDEMVSEEVIRTTANGTYDGTVAIPFYKDIPDGDATLRIIGQNTKFGTTTEDRTVSVSRPTPDYLTLKIDEAEYRMDPTGTPFEYAVTDNFPQKPKAYIETPELDDEGSIVTFGYASGSIAADATDPIPFSNSSAGEYTIKLNIKSFEASPFTKLLFNGAEMTMLDDDNYYIVATLTKDSTYELTGITDFDGWNIDRDYFERPDAQEPDKIKFLPMTSLYKVTANFKHNYLKIEAMKSETELATLNDDGAGAIWAIGGTSVGKPSLKNAFGWSPENGGMCLARVADNKYQLTLVAGVSIDASSFDFKFFHQKTWGEEFGGGTITTTSDVVKINDSGNVQNVAGNRLELGGIYCFTVDISGGKTAAVLTVEKVGTQPLPPADLKVNGTQMTMVDADNFSVDIDLTQNETITFGGADAFTPVWINPDFFAVSGTDVKLAPLSGKYRILVNIPDKIIDALSLNADGSGLATLSDDGHGAVYFIGWGIGSPNTSYQPGWTTEKGICVPEYASGIYKMTAQAGEENSTTFGQRFRVSGWDGKFFTERGWGGLGTFALTPGAEALLQITDGGNIQIADGVTLDEGTTYELTLDCTAGKDNPKLTFVKK